MQVEITSRNNRTYFSFKDEYGKINPFQLAIFAKSGHGKGLTNESFAEKWRESTNGIVIYLADPKNEAEASFVQYKPIELYHVNKLKEDGGIPKSHKAKLYHPFTFNIPKGFLPPINFFTVSLKSMTREDWSILLEAEKTSESAKLLLRIGESLKKNDGLFNFLHKIEKLTKGKKDKKKSVPDWDNFGLSVGGGTSKSVTEIAGLLAPFKNNYLLRKDSCEHTLNWKEILTDNQHYHIFLSMWLKDEKMQQFMVLNLLKQIINNRHFAKRPILLIIPEIQHQCPRNPQGYKLFLSQEITKALITCRSQGRGISSITDSQNWSETDDKIKGAATITLFGALGTSDSDRVVKAMGYKREIREQLQNMNYKNSYLIAGYESDGAFRSFMPKHMHKEPQYNWIEMYKKHFNEKMIRYSDLVEEMRKKYSLEEEFTRDIVKKRYDEEKAEKERIKVEKEEMQESKSKPEKKKGKEDDNRMFKMKLCYERFNDKNLTKKERGYRAIGRKYELNHMTVKKYIDNYKKILEDNKPSVENISHMVGSGILEEEISEQFGDD